MNLSRRRFTSLFTASAGGLLLPRRLAAAKSVERKFLFVFCRGGWDTSYVFTPLLDHPALEPEPGAEMLEAGGIPFVHNDTRPSVAEFFSRHAERTCVLNGLEIRSVTHERCSQLALTGSSGGGDDWPTLLAASSERDLLFPHLVVAGPAYTADYSNLVVRVGDNGQLPELLEGSALNTSALPVSAPSVQVEEMTDAFARARTDILLGKANRGQQSFLQDYRDALDDLEELRSYSEELSLRSELVGCRRNNAADAALVFDTFSKGLARCGMIEDLGWCGNSWDTHDGNQMQDWHFEELFASLLQIMDDLENRPGEVSDRLADEVTVVVMSEMGRHPQANSRGGKEHWTYTSAMVIGSGVAGGQMIGGLDSDGRGLPIDLSSGEANTTGTALTGDHLGATLLALGDVDPSEFLFEIDPVAALIA